ncbi:MAG: HDIG domain-containing protein [Clostridiales bacterium]|nr:HDIG domain-containing protein [Clostridiales bacterium]
MRKTKSQKVLNWGTKDVVLNVLVYVLNAVVITGLFYLTVYVNGITGQKGLESLSKNPTTFLHFILLLVLTISIMAFYFAFEDRDFLKRAVNSQMIFLIIELGILACSAIGAYVNVNLRPLAFVALLTLFVTNRRTAIFTNIIFCVIIFLFDSFGGNVFSVGNYPILIMGFSSGVIAAVSMDKASSRLKLLLRSILISLPSLLCVGMDIIENGGDNVVADLVSAGFSGPLVVAIFMILLPVFEAMFKKVSSFKYSELTDHKSKLIKKLIQQAPGTFNHSIVVCNIAEACAAAIEEDALLARTCAYYHDVGKLRRPEFFKENQADGVNPHDDLTPELSANIIKAHAQDGYNLVIKNRLPQEIADVCLQHHGTLPIIYFYDKARKFTDGDVDLLQYCYPGPKPKTKIAAIIMIADGCEAAARSLQDRSRENVKKVVRKIVNDRMELGQFDDCEITLKELNIIIHTVVNNLTGIYHSRIEYPKVNLEGMDL